VRSAEWNSAIQQIGNPRYDAAPEAGVTVQGFATLPVSTLEPSPEISEILSRWGIRTVGEFLALGKDNLAERLGPAALELFERVSINSIRPLKLVSPPQEFAEEIVKLIKDSKLKVQTSIQGDQVRVTGKKRDDLQEAIALVRGAELKQPFQFTNFRD